jgi:O-acetylhomoserine (thiol)-lyase
MPAPKPPAFETLSLHAGQHPDPVTRSRAVPIYQTTSYVFDDADHAAGLFNLERAGHIYTRISNPTTAVLEERLAALEDGVGAVCTASGMAAMHLAIATLLSSGDHIVASASLYGGSINLLTHTLPRFGITTTFVKPRDLDGFRAAIGERTRLIIGETIGNPGLEVLDIPKVADIAHGAGIPLLVDNTFASRLAFDHQMDRRPRHRHRRRHCRWRPLRLAGVGQILDLDRAVCRLSRHRLCRGVRPDRFHHAGAGRRLARLRRVPLAD